MNVCTLAFAVRSCIFESRQNDFILHGCGWGVTQEYIQGGFFNWSGLKMTKSQPLKEFSELVLPKKRPRMKKV